MEMRRLKWQIVLAGSLIAVSALVYTLQIVIFRNARDTAFYLFQDLAFIPIQVILVTFVLNKLLSMREQQAMLNKLNMVIGTFFSEVGTGLIKSFAAFDRNADKLRKELLVTIDWSDPQFASAVKNITSFDYQVYHTNGDLAALKDLLLDKREFLLGLLENPNLLEHETFTDLLWAVFHLTEELAVRENLRQLTPADGNHIAGDIRRAYTILIIEWLAYMKHLKHDYPYLFSFAIRTNPFDPNASVIVK
jgi:hypothetical protein